MLKEQKMKKLLMVLIGMGIVLIISIRAWIHYFPVEPISKYVEQNKVEEVAVAPIPEPVKVKPKPIKLFKCDDREYCSQMKSYDEAKYFTDYCPNTKMDGDDDGIPCESQFGR